MKSGDKWRIPCSLFSFTITYLMGRKQKALLFSPFLQLMFIGEYYHTLDEKNRVAVPVKFRKELAGGAVVTRGIDNCLFLLQKREWKKLVDKISALPLSQSKARAFARLVLAGAMEVEIDKQGRIILPDYLRQYAKLKKRLVLAGVLNRLEIWDEKAWKEYKQRTEKESEEIADQLGDLGII